MVSETLSAAAAVVTIVVGMALLIAGTADATWSTTATVGGLLMLLSIGWTSWSVGRAEAPESAHD